MISLKIDKINKNLYTLKDIDGTTYELVLKFLDIDFMLDVGDTIHMNQQLLDESYEGYNSYYTFGNLSNSYGKENISTSDTDIIRITSKNKTILLKRLYG